MNLTKTPVIGIFGNPNSGKSSLFNLLTGMNQKTGNFAGVTVEKKAGKLILNNGLKSKIIDFPGSYSIHPLSIDERIVTNVLLHPDDSHYPDVAVYIVDITHLERHLLFLTQLIDLKIPVVVALNMSDIDPNYNLKRELLQDFLRLPVIAVSAKKNSGIKELKASIQEVLENPAKGISHRSFTDEKNSESYLSHLRSLLQDERSSTTLNYQVSDTMSRFNSISPLIQNPAFRHKSDTGSLTLKLDKWLMHPFWGLLIFVFILWMIFQSIFNIAEKPIELLETSFTILSGWVMSTFPSGWLTDLVAQGILPGLSGVIVFVPQIALLFLFISILEESGYMPRVIYLCNFVMQRFGLNGRSIVALISGAACAIPAIMSTRTISNTKERLITIMTTPLVSCSARLPVYSLLITFVIPGGYMLGFINKRGLAFFTIYAVSIFFAFLFSWIFKKTLKSDEPNSFMLELPEYKLPLIKNVAINVWNKVKSFIQEAGKIILIISMILWFLASYGPGDFKSSAQSASKPVVKTEQQSTYTPSGDAVRLEQSYAGIMGRWIEPVIKPLGFDWKIGIALITSFAAREVFVGTIATIYSANDGGSPENLSDLLARQVNPDTGEKVFNTATSASLIVFYLFALQCLSTLAVVKKETNSWKWPMIQLFAYSGLAYLASFIVYQLLS
jgi:ferrous iron transport protein B